MSYPVQSAITATAELLVSMFYCSVVLLSATG